VLYALFTFGGDARVAEARSKREGVQIGCRHVGPEPTWRPDL